MRVTKVKHLKHNINELKEAEKGKRCFIIASGPSVNKKDLSDINDEVLIGANKGGMAESLWNIDMNYLVTADGYVLAKNWDMYRNTKAKIVLTQATVDFGRPDCGWSTINKENKFWLYENAYFVDAISYSKGRVREDIISFDLAKGHVGAGTVVQDIGIPLAVWLGCKEIYLLGCDCDSSGYFDNAIKNPFIGHEVVDQYIEYKKKLDKEGIKIFNINYKPNSCPGIDKIDLSDIL